MKRIKRRCRKWEKNVLNAERLLVANNGCILQKCAVDVISNIEESFW